MHLFVVPVVGRIHLKTPDRAVTVALAMDIKLQKRVGG